MSLNFRIFDIKGKLLLSCLIGGAVVVVYAFFCFFLRSPTCNHPDNYPKSRTIRYSYTLHNKTNRLVQNVNFLTFAPVKKTSTQYCETIEASHEFDMAEDGFGNQVMTFSFNQFPPYGTKIITIKAVLSMADEPNCAFSETDRFLVGEEYVELDHPDIVELGNHLKEKKIQDTAYRIFKWVAENIQYSGYQSEERGALTAFRTRKGDCTEFMRLFVALCRVDDIPSRSIGGYVCRGDQIVTPTDYHNWGEFYSGGVWNLSDPQKKKFMEDASDYIIMQIISEFADNPMNGFGRFRIEGDGMEVKMNS
jgi:hypothetical protein